jgi:hypothetical protein
METSALSLADALAFLKKHERHYTEPAEPLCAIGLSENGTLHGAALLGRTAEGDAVLAHLYCDGVWQGYSLLYGASWRAFKALGYKRLIL